MQTIKDALKFRFSATGCHLFRQSLATPIYVHPLRILLSNSALLRAVTELKWPQELVKRLEQFLLLVYE